MWRLFALVETVWSIISVCFLSLEKNQSWLTIQLQYFSYNFSPPSATPSLWKWQCVKYAILLTTNTAQKFVHMILGKKPFDSKKDAKWPILTQNFKQLFSQHTVCFFGQFFQKKNFGFFSFWYNELVHFFRLSSLHTQKTLSRFSVYEKNDDEFEQKTYCKLLFYSWLYTLYVYIIFSTYSSKNHAAVYHD